MQKYGNQEKATTWCEKTQLYSILEFINDIIVFIISDIYRDINTYYKINPICTCYVWSAILDIKLGFCKYGFSTFQSFGIQSRVIQTVASHVVWWGQSWQKSI